MNRRPLTPSSWGGGRALEGRSPYPATASRLLQRNKRPFVEMEPNCGTGAAILTTRIDITDSTLILARRISGLPSAVQEQSVGFRLPRGLGQAVRYVSSARPPCSRSRPEGARPGAELPEATAYCRPVVCDWDGLSVGSVCGISAAFSLSSGPDLPGRALSDEMAPRRSWAH